MRPQIELGYCVSSHQPQERICILILPEVITPTMSKNEVDGRVLSVEGFRRQMLSRRSARVVSRDIQGDLLAAPITGPLVRDGKAMKAPADSVLGLVVLLEGGLGREPIAANSTNTEKEARRIHGNCRTCRSAGHSAMSPPLPVMEYGFPLITGRSPSCLTKQATFASRHCARIDEA